MIATNGIILSHFVENNTSAHFLKATGAAGAHYVIALVYPQCNALKNAYWPKSLLPKLILLHPIKITFKINKNHTILKLNV